MGHCGKHFSRHHGQVPELADLLALGVDDGFTEYGAEKNLAHHHIVHDRFTIKKGPLWRKGLGRAKTLISPGLSFGRAQRRSEL